MEARLVSGGLDNGTSVANLATHVRNLGMVWKVGRVWKVVPESKTSC